MSPKGERLMVPRAAFRSYYGRPVLKPPVWAELDIAGYLFLGGLAAGSALLAAGADLTGRPALRRTARTGALGAVLLSTVALVHDLGRPARALNMLRTVKPTSPMSVGSWILAGFGPLAGVAAASELAGSLPLPARQRGLLAGAGRAAGLGAAGLAPALASYTAVLLADTAVPTWHESRAELPWVFVGGAAAAAGGVALVGVPVREAGPARRLAVAGAVLELAATHRMETRHGLVGEPLSTGRAGRLLTVARALTAAGALLGAAGGRSRLIGAVGGAALAAGSAATRFGVFAAGIAASKDPRYTLVPQRERVAGAPAG